MSAPLTWDEIVEHCSRLHTTRTRRTLPAELFPDDDELREDSQPLDVIADGWTATIVPTRMHEPGFYVRVKDGSEFGALWRSDETLAAFRQMVTDGRVFTAEPEQVA